VNWLAVRDKMVEAFAEVILALKECKSGEDLLLVLELVERYPSLAKGELRSPSTGPRIEAMRAAVHSMRGAVEPVDPLKKKGGT